MEQAIADYAVLIQHLRQQYRFTRVVAFGGRYALIRITVVNDYFYGHVVYVSHPSLDHVTKCLMLIASFSCGCPVFIHVMTVFPHGCESIYHMMMHLQLWRPA